MTLRYLIDGDGQWMSRWHCTGGDTTLLLVTVIPVLWMVGEYFIYGWRTWIAPDSSRVERRHRVWLAIVFVVCGLIHGANLLISWFWTPYYLVAMAYWANAILTHLLNQSQVQLQEQQEHGVRRALELDVRDIVRSDEPDIRKRLAHALARLEQASNQEQT